MSVNDINKAYVSPYDTFLMEWDATHKKTASQIKEIEKSRRIALMRDDKDYKSEPVEIWELF